MVAYSGAPVRADRLRPLNVPRPLRVDADARGWPVTVYFRGPRRGNTRGVSGGVPVLEVLDRWRIDDEWWRKEISRMYFHVVLDAGGSPLVMTIFHDLVGDGWFAQTTAVPIEEAEPLHVIAPSIAAAAADADEVGKKTLPERRVGVA